jgi:eukaryotic-like serine/threonine-protein kinase
MPDTDQATRYREIRRLGAGGMATVTLAQDTVLDRPVALKRVYGAGDPRGLLRLKREAMVGASLSHPNLVFVYDAQLSEDGAVVIVMEYVEGETLAERLSSGGALGPDETVRVLRGVAAALDAIHEQGIVHRDVKPANVLLGRTGDVKLADLGVADVADRTRITSTGAVVGSFNYMAPEQLEGADPSPAMDVYALAALAFEMLTGDRARPEPNPLALAHAIATQPPPDLRRAWPAAPAAAAMVLRRAMSSNPSERPTSAGELVKRLEAALAPERPTEAVAAPATDRPKRRAPIPPPPGPATRRRSSILVPALLALAALGVAALLFAILSSGGGAPKPNTSASHPSSSPSKRRTATRAASSTSTRTSGAATASPQSQTTPAAASQSQTTPAAASQSTTTPPASSTVTASSGTPAGSVEQFYTDAANHQYAQAWALADPNLQNQLHGYAAFQNLMSPVRAITFHRAETLPGSSANAATVALRTTSVQTSGAQQCSGTARTVRTGSGPWLLDGISISCTP